LGEAMLPLSRYQTGEATNRRVVQAVRLRRTEREIVPCRHPTLIATWKRVRCEIAIGSSVTAACSSCPMLVSWPILAIALISQSFNSMQLKQPRRLTGRAGGGC
jgi:hypothetical protein